MMGFAFEKFHGGAGEIFRNIFENRTFRAVCISAIKPVIAVILRHRGLPLQVRYVHLSRHVPARRQARNAPKK